MESQQSKTGWVRSIRQSKAITFCSCTNGADEFQLTIKDGAQVNGTLKVGCSFLALGKDSTTPRGLYEFDAAKVTIVGESDDSFPIQPKEHGDDFLRTIPESRGRSLRYADRWKVRSIASQGVHDVMKELGCYQYFTPIVTEADCEGAGETFRASTDWMDASLTVSGQLHLEVGMMSLGRVYTFSPCFRAEKSMTRKHLSEFWMLEVEMANANLDSMMDVCQGVIRGIMASVVLLHKDGREELAAKLDSHHIGLSRVQNSQDWPRISYAQACMDLDLKWGDDIGSEAEKKITEIYKGPVFITHYPQEMKPFYMRKHDGVAYCFDLIFPEVGELAGGSEREHDHDKLRVAMEGSGMDMSKMQWYLDTRKWGTVPHAGFGLGFERLVMYLTGAEKVHDVIPFPVAYK